MSSDQKHMIGDLFFWSQIVCTIVFCVTQAMKMLESTQGVCLSYFLCQGIFALLNLSLSVVALRESTRGDRKVKKQSVSIYALWVLVPVTHISIAFWKMPDLWKLTDTTTVSVVTLGVIATVIFAKVAQLPLLDPYMKAGLAVFFKSVPQIALAFNIALYGKGGLSGIWILMGHVTIITRLIHLWVSNREQWNRNTKGSLMSEIWNEASWLVATTSWLVF